MSDKKYIILEQHIFDKSGNVKDMWSVKFANLEEDKAFQKLVALRSLNEDTEKVYHIVNMEYLWSKQDEPLVLTDEVKDNQKDLPF